MWLLISGLICLSKEEMSSLWVIGHIQRYTHFNLCWHILFIVVIYPSVLVCVYMIWEPPITLFGAIRSVQSMGFQVDSVCDSQQWLNPKFWWGEAWELELLVNCWSTYWRCFRLWILIQVLLDYKVYIEWKIINTLLYNWIYFGWLESHALHDCKSNFINWTPLTWVLHHSNLPLPTSFCHHYAKRQ